MPRKPRIENIGFHHIINKGVARGDIFFKDNDFIVHSFDRDKK